MSNILDQYPYLNVNDLNLDYILNAIKKFQNEVTNFVSINAIKYANPIQWNITSQYEKNTIVIDPQSGTAYISVAAVPSGVALTREEYWTVVFDLEQFVTKANSNFTIRVEEQTTLTATFPTNKDSWVVWGGVLYKAKTDIIAGDQYVIDSNIEAITIEEIIGHNEDLPTENKTSIVASINEIYTLFNNIIGDLDDLSTTDKSNIVAAINEVLLTLNTIIGSLDDLSTTDKSDVVSAINEVLSTLTDKIENSKLLHVLNGIRYYVDGVNGDDDNDGSIDAPFKTLDKFFSVANDTYNGRIDIRCFIVSAGTYNIGSGAEHTINHLTIHITGNVSGVILQFISTEDAKFYECHLNLNNVSLVTTSTSTPYISIDGGSFAIVNCKFLSQVRVYSAQGYFRDCEILSCEATESTILFRNVIITNRDPSVTAYYFDTCLIRLRGSAQQEELTEDGTSNSYIEGRSSFIDASITMRQRTFRYYYGLNCSFSTIHLPNDQYNFFKTRCVYGDIAKGGNLISLTDSNNDNIIVPVVQKQHQSGLTSGITVAAQSVVSTYITFPVEFNNQPNVIACLASINPSTNYLDGACSIVVSNISSTGCSLDLCNSSDSSISRRIMWYAFDNNY